MTALFEATPGTFPDLEIISELGRGAETVVYRVRRRGREYALKLLATAGSNPRALTSLRREAALLGCVGHPLLPKILEVGQVEAGPYLIQEYIDGWPLSDVLGAGPLDESRALRLAIDVVGQLAAAHRAGLVHRDVKPANIIIGPDGTARLIDFGLVFRHGAHPDQIAGTLLYSAPEQTGMISRLVDGRSDLYALGVLLFECATGRPPYHSFDARELMRLHARAPAPDPRSLRPDLSPVFAAIVDRLIAKDPDDRYPDGDSLLADLHRLYSEPQAVFHLGQSGGTARPTGPEVLLGRDEEIVDLANRWLKARAGRGGAAIVEGPSGVGKSRLVQELTNAVAADENLVLYGKCVPDDPVPLAPLRAAVEGYIRTIDRLPQDQRERTIERLRRAAGRGGPLLRALSPLLADLVQAPVIGQDNRHEQFINAAAAFLLGLAHEFHGAVLHIDDIQWLDDSTRRVLQHVTIRLPGTALLVIATSRDDDESAPALERFCSDMDATLDTRIQLRPLYRESAADLVAFHLGGVQVGNEAIDELASRAGGNPFTVIEYVRAVIDAGLITPSWDTWHMDLAGLDRLDLSGDALDLVIQRIDGLGEQSRWLLAAAAACGRRFRSDLVSMAAGVDPHQGQMAFTEAVSRRLVAPSGTYGYRFRHDRIREALLAELDPAMLRRLHQRIAEVLEATGSDDSRNVYLTARHYALGERDRTPHKVYETSLAAGQRALAEHAPAEAREFLLVAASAAHHAGLTPSSDLYLALGISCARTGRYGEALNYLDHVLRVEPNSLHRAEVLGQIAWVHTSAWDPESAIDAVRRGLRELGRPFPRTKLGVLIGTLARFFAGLFIGVTKIGFGTAEGDKRESYRVEASLYDAGRYSWSIRMDRKMSAIFSLRVLKVINRLGPCAEYVRHQAGFALMADLTGRPKLATKLYDRAAAVATKIADPTLVASVEWKRGVGRHLSAADDGQLWMRLLIEHERWLELGEYLTGVTMACVQMVQRGRTHEARTWYARGKARLGTAPEGEGAAFGVLSAAIAGQLGRPDDAAAGLDVQRRFLASNPHNLTRLINFLVTQLIVLVELGELGAPFEEVTREFTQLGLDVSTLIPEQRAFMVYEAFGRLAQYRQAQPERRAQRQAAAEAAVVRLGKVADRGLLRAFHHVALADLEVLANRPQAALSELHRAEVEVLPLDAPLVSYEMARVRARVLRALDEPAQARMYARHALMFAVDQEWERRIQWIRGEFGISSSTSSHGSQGSLGSGSHRARTVQISDS